MSRQLAQIAKKAKLDRKMRFTSLAHLFTPEFLTETWGMMNRHGASGIDGESTQQFESGLEQRIREICGRLKTGVYLAPPVRRVEIPKGPGKSGTRPLGIPTVEDRLLQLWATPHGVIKAAMALCPNPSPWQTPAPMATSAINAPAQARTSR